MNNNELYPFNVTLTVKNEAQLEKIKAAIEEIDREQKQRGITYPKLIDSKTSRLTIEEAEARSNKLSWAKAICEVVLLVAIRKGAKIKYSKQTKMF